MIVVNGCTIVDRIELVNVVVMIDEHEYAVEAEAEGVVVSDTGVDWGIAGGVGSEDKGVET